jgi:hypothetical protein
VRPDLVLGFDPTPSDPHRLVVLSDAVRKVVRTLVQSRAELGPIGRTGSVWDGPVGAPIAALLRRFSLQMSALEESLVDCLQAVDNWREGTEQRQAQVANIVASVADLAGDPTTEDRRTRLIAAARELGVEHDRAAADLTGAFEELSGAVEQIVRADDDLAGELDRALMALTAAIDDWIAAEAPELLRTAIALGEVAGLTTVISELVGIAALGRKPGEAAGVSDIIARSPGSHRLIRALRRQWLEVAPAALPEATFSIRQSGGLESRMSGRRPLRSDQGDSGSAAGADAAAAGGHLGSGE